MMMYMRTYMIIFMRMYMIDNMMIYADDGDGEKHTNAECGCGICCSERACQGNQRRRTCNILFEDPPL